MRIHRYNFLSCYTYTYFSNWKDISDFIIYIYKSIDMKKEELKNNYKTTNTEMMINIISWIIFNNLYSGKKKYGRCIYVARVTSYLNVTVKQYKNMFLITYI